MVGGPPPRVILVIGGVALGVSSPSRDGPWGGTSKGSRGWVFSWHGWAPSLCFLPLSVKPFFS